MIQLSTLPPAGVLSGGRAAGFPLGTTSDFALALADLAVAPGLVAAPPAPPGGAVFATIPNMAMRQALAGDGNGLPVAPGIMVDVAVAPGVPETAPNPAVPTTAVAPFVLSAAVPFAAIAIAPEPTVSAEGPPPLVPDAATGGAKPVLAIRTTVAATAPAPGPQVSVAPAIVPAMVVTPSPSSKASDDVVAAPGEAPSRPRRTPLAAAPIVLSVAPVAAHEDAPTGPIARVDESDDAPIIASPAPGSTPPAPIALPVVVPTTPIPPVIAVTPEPAPTRAARPTLATPAVPAATPAGTDLAQRASVTAVAAPALPRVLAPKPAPTIPHTAPSPVTAAAAATPVGATTSPSAVPVQPAPNRRRAVAAAPGIAALQTGERAQAARVRPEPTPSVQPATALVVGDTPPTAVAADAPPVVRAQTVTAPDLTPRTAERIAQALAPAAPSPDALPVVQPPVGPVSVVAQQPVTTAVTIAVTSAEPIVPATVAPAAAVPLAQPLSSPSPVEARPLAPAPIAQVPATPVVVTVVALPVAPPPAPQLQPAAQAFAAAMFAAAAPIDPARDDRDDNLPLALVAATAPAVLHGPIAIVHGAASSPQPTLDLARHDWMASMIDHIETLRDDSGGVRETRMRLAPDALGNVEVSVRRDENGAMQVRIAADTPQARAILADAAPRLVEMAEARGLKLGGSSVDANAAGFADHGRRDVPAASALRRAPTVAANDADATDTDSRIA